MPPEVAKPTTLLSSPEVKTSVSVGLGVAASEVHRVQVVAAEGTPWTPSPYPAIPSTR